MIQTAIDYTRDFRRGKTFGTTGVIDNCPYCGRKGKLTGSKDNLLVVHKTGEQKDYCTAQLAKHKAIEAKPAGYVEITLAPAVISSDRIWQPIKQKFLKPNSKQLGRSPLNYILVINRKARVIV